MEDGDVNITQSTAIMRYLAQKHDLMGSTPAEKARCDMLCDGANELFDFWVASLWANDVSSIRVFLRSSVCSLTLTCMHMRRNKLCDLLQEKREQAVKDALPDKLKFHEVIFFGWTKWFNG